MKKIRIKKEYCEMLACLFFFCAVWCVSAFIPPVIPETENADTTVSEKYNYYAVNNVRFMLYFADTKRLIELDFASQITHIISPSSPYFEECKKSLTLDSEALCKIIDRFGGIDTALPFICNGYDNLPRRYTGTQILDLLSHKDIEEIQKDSFKTDIIINILKNISNSGLWESDFAYIMNVSESNISYVDYYDLRDHLAGCFAECDFY